MKIGYAIDRDPAALRAIGATRIYVDTRTSERAERAALFATLRPGDVIILLSRSDLGHGREIGRFERLAGDRGATFDVRETGKPTPIRGRQSPRFDPSPEQERRIRHYWHGPFKASEALRQASDIMGFPVTRNHLNRRLGARSGRNDVNGAAT